MPTPSKPFSVLTAEGKSHRTKKELLARRDGEAATLTGKAMKERPAVKDKPASHKEFLRIKNLLKEIGKADALYEPVINRYCQLMAECTELEEKREHCYQLVMKLEEVAETLHEMDQLDADGLFSLTKEFTKLSATLISYDRQVQAKRRMLLDIEKENIMTIAAALRSVPKAPEQKENPLMKALRGG